MYLLDLMRDMLAEHIEAPRESIVPVVAPIEPLLREGAA